LEGITIYATENKLLIQRESHDENVALKVNYINIHKKIATRPDTWPSFTSKGRK